MFRVLKRRRHAALLLSIASVALAAPDAARAADDFFGLTTAISGSPIMSGDGSKIVVNRSTGGAAVWSATGLTTLPGPTTVDGISADGSVIVGSYSNQFTAWRGSAMTVLNRLPSTAFYGHIYALSADGRYAVGDAPRANATGSNRAPVIWNTSTGLVLDIGDTPNGTNYGHATAVSADGSVVVGYNWTATYEQVFRWENGVRLDLPGLHSQNFLLSGNGQVIADRNQGWRWIGGANGAPVMNVVYLPGSLSAQVNALSYDGKTVVGYAALPGNQAHGFRWIDGTGTDLGTLGGPLSTASDVSADGKVAVGYSFDAALKQRAVRWGEDGKIKSIADLLTAGGVDISGWTLTEAKTVSDDGNIILGSGTDSSNTSGYWITHCVAACKEPDPVLAIITPATAAESFSGLGGLGGTASTYLGSQSDALGDMAEAGKDKPLTGFAYGAFDSDPTVSATVGATYSLGNDLVIAGSLGIAGVQTLLPFSGTANFAGPSATLLVASKPDSGFNWLVGGSLVGLTGTINRGYLNGNTPVISTGSTTGSGAGFTAEAGWTFNDLIADTLVTPFVSVTVSSMNYAGYTETGGPFPSSFAAFSTSSALLRIGADARYQFSKDSYLSTGLSYGHNFGNGGTVAGTIAGIALSVPGAAPISDFVEASIGIDLPITEAVTFSGRLAAILPFGGTPSVQARAGVTMAF